MFDDENEKYIDVLCWLVISVGIIYLGIMILQFLLSPALS